MSTKEYYELQSVDIKPIKPPMLLIVYVIFFITLFYLFASITACYVYGLYVPWQVLFTTYFGSVLSILVGRTHVRDVKYCNKINSELVKLQKTFWETTRNSASKVPNK